jgi:protein-S-isoprenylcysteine O-methyltransferase Ste14
MRIKKLNSYLSNIILIWISILIYFSLPFYSNFLSSNTRTALLVFAVGYTIIGLFFHSLTKDYTPSKGLLIFSYLIKVFRGLKNGELIKIEGEEKNAVLFGLVKFFFLPIMINFFFANLNSLIPSFQRMNVRSFMTIHGFNTFLFPVLLSLIFLFDTSVFTFGYMFESRLLKNKLKSVEPTIFGWVVALACYPPFNSFTGQIIASSNNDYFSFPNETYTFILRIALLLLYSIYLSATFALGAKSSNLTNRGIVSRGPYAIVRHPAYISKNLAWIMTVLPLGSITALLSMLAWAFIYHLRAITEERHLKQDPDYIEYCKKVRYRYIPGVY